MGGNLTPLTPDELSHAAQAEIAQSRGRQKSQTPDRPVQTWLWIMVALIVLLTFAAGAIAGFLGGRWYERNHQTPSPPPLVDVYWLLGAQPVESDGIVYLTSIYPNGPAQTAGIEENDQLLDIEGEATLSADDVSSILSGYEPGDTVLVTIERAHRRMQFYVVLGLITASTAPPVTLVPTEPPYILPPDQLEDARLGIYYRMLQPGDPFAVAEGALIITLPGSETPALRAGLAPGDIITHVGGLQVTTRSPLEVVLDSFYAGETVTLSINRAGADLELRATLAGD
jgi:S1-C subfamily serine protease